jgi:hypothetical protein
VRKISCSMTLYTSTQPSSDPIAAITFPENSVVAKEADLPLLGVLVSNSHITVPLTASQAVTFRVPTPSATVISLRSFVRATKATSAHCLRLPTRVW